jgi:hypothetical protein
LEITEYYAEKFHGHFVISQTNVMRGTIDIAASLIGDENVIIAMYEHPDEFKELMDKQTDICINVMKVQNNVIPSFHGGYVNPYGIWAPGTVTRHQEDKVSFISPKFYKEFVMPHDRKLCQAFDYTTIHFHSANHIHCDAITDITELGALQINLEPPPYGPTLNEWIVILKRLIKKKPLILQACKLTREQISNMLEEIPTQGLLLETTVQETGENYYVYRE